MRIAPAQGIVLVLGLACIAGGDAASKPEPIKVAGIENVFRLSPRIYSGAQPEGAEGFETLRRLGIKTILSVDGSIPDIEAARKLGMRYVHLPVGYDGIPREQGVRIVEAVRTLPGPVFVHCHHGQHRGPAAAALCGIAVEGWGNRDAVAWLKQAGTAPQYRGLFATVDAFKAPTAEESKRAGGAFPERAETPTSVDLMVAIDGRWDRLKAAKAAGFEVPKDHPDVDPPHEALQLAEGFKEFARLPETKARGAEFVGNVEAAARLAADFEAGLRRHAKGPTEASRKGLESTFAAIGKSCTKCHAANRDNK